MTFPNGKKQAIFSCRNVSPRTSYEDKESPTIGLSTMEASGIPASSSGGEKCEQGEGNG